MFRFLRLFAYGNFRCFFRVGYVACLRLRGRSFRRYEFVGVRRFRRIRSFRAFRRCVRGSVRQILIEARHDIVGCTARKLHYRAKNQQTRVADYADDGRDDERGNRLREREYEHTDRGKRAYLALRDNLRHQNGNGGIHENTAKNRQGQENQKAYRAELQAKREHYRYAYRAECKQVFRGDFSTSPRIN